ncbi:MAG: SctK family type III secretion system sorting platform protein [Arenicella sp.]
MNDSRNYQFLLFSLSPSSYIHPSWLETMQIDKIFSWEGGPVNKDKLLSEFLFGQSNLKHIDFESFSQEEKNVLILDPQSTKLLVSYLGIFFCQDLLKRHILKSQVMAIKSDFGKDAYSFGLKKAPYLLKNRNIIFPDNKNSLNVGGEIVAYGMTCLQAYLALYADDVQKRVFWKLPSHWQANDYDISRDNAVSLINAILQEVK